MIKTIKTKITTNNYQTSNNKNKNKKSPPYIQKSLSSKCTSPIELQIELYNFGSKTARHFLQY